MIPRLVVLLAAVLLAPAGARAGQEPAPVSWMAGVRGDARRFAAGAVDRTPPRRRSGRRTAGVVDGARGAERFTVPARR